VVDDGDPGHGRCTLSEIAAVKSPTPSGGQVPRVVDLYA
jgi:hypothetical protein